MHIFDTDMLLEKDTTQPLMTRVSGDWSISNVPNGGYLLALLTNAMLTSTDKKATPIITVTYFSRCVPGPAELHVETISQTTQFNHLQVKLIQGGEERIRAMGTFAAEPDECFLINYEKAPPDMAPPEECLAIPEMPGYTLYNHVDTRLDPENAGWMMDKLSDMSEHKGWIRFKEDRPFDLLSVILATDAFPPAILASQGIIAWVPTIELSVSIRSIPSTKWLKGIFKTRFINCGLLEEDGEIWDENGELVAISRQIAQFRKTI